MLKHVVILFLSILPFQQLLASDTIYIDPGSTSQIQIGSRKFPLKSWEGIIFKTANIYLQKRNTTVFTDGILINKAEISIGAYGQGKKPEMILNSNSEKPVLKINSSHVKVNNIRFEAGNSLAAIFIEGDKANNIIISECETYGGFNGIRITGNSYGQNISNCIIKQSLDDGVFAKNIRSIVLNGNKISEVNNNWFHNKDENYSSGDCIQILSENKLFFELRNNILDHSSTGNKFCFIVSGNDYSGVITGNTLTGNLQGNTSAIYLHPTKNLIEISYNKISDSPFGIYNYANRLIIFYNIFQDNEIAFSSRVQGKSLFYNNVFDNNMKVFENDVADRIIACNNIFIPAPGSPYLFRQSKQLNAGYNCFFVKEPGLILPDVTAKDYFTKGLAGKHSFQGNPGFDFTSPSGYKLSSQSPCIDKGRNVKISKDYFGHKVPVNGSTDIGIHEYSKN